MCHTKKMKNLCTPKILFWVLLLFLGLILDGCKKQAFPAPEDAVIIISADKVTIALNDTIHITIQGYHDDGSYLWDGTHIDLTIENGSLDRTAVELENGTASVTAQGNMEPGEMKIYARSGNINATPNPLVIDVNQDSPVARITASINPPILPYTGGRVQIIATVLDEQLSPLPNINVVIETDAGVLDSRGTPLVTNTAGQVIDYLQTNQEATVHIYAGDQDHTISIPLETEPEPNKDPVADFYYSPEDPVSGESVYFNASASTDEDGTITKYFWDFGDGSTGLGKTTKHQFQLGTFSTRTFVVTLTVYDNEERSNSVSKWVKVDLIKTMDYSSDEKF